MKNLLNGRMILVLVLAALSLFFVWPTVDYYNFVRTLPQEGQPTQEQLAIKREKLEQSNMVKLGLDLQGGVNFLIAVDLERLRRQDLENLADSVRRDLIQDRIDADVKLLDDEPAFTLSVRQIADVNMAADVLKRYQGSLVWDDIANLEGGVVTIRQNPDVLRNTTEEAVTAALRTVSRRVDEYGLTQPEVVLQGRDRIRVTVPGETDPDRIRTGLLKTANLEFRLLHPDHDSIIGNFTKPGSSVAGTGIIKDEYLVEVINPETGRPAKRLAKDIPGLPAGYKLYLGVANVDDGKGGQTRIENLAYILRQRPELTGKQLRRAAAYTDLNDLSSPIKVSLEFNAEGTEKFAEVTKDNVDRRFAIVLDDLVYSAPNIREPILYGRCEISGGFTQQEANDLSLVLKAGALPAPLRIVDEQAVGPSLGQDSIIASGRAVLYGAIALVIVMVAIYSVAGGIAVVAMILNTLMILAFLSMANATLTLSGIGGILLTMGMAVDANVLIYERLREELALGKSLRAAVNAAFDRAFTVIMDSNITSLLPAIVLIMFEIVEGSIKGFWVALAIGLVANVYTGLTVTRALIEAWVAKRGTISLGKVYLFKNANYDFMKFRNVGYIVSGGLVALSLFYLVVHGPNWGVDFTGGVIATIRDESGQAQRVAIESALKKDFHDVKVVAVLNSNRFQVTVPVDDKNGEDADKVKGKLSSALSTVADGKIVVESSQTVDAAIGSEIQMTALLTILVTSAVILGYLALRFRPVFGAGAVVALLHDLIISLGLFVVMGRSVTLDIVSALLIVLGYGVNDTIVVFDRIRETLANSYGKKIGDVINEAVNVTLSRTMLTSGTTIATTVSMLLFGGVGLRDFALILLIGFVIGTYSSVFVASVVVYSFVTRQEKKYGVEKATTPKKTVKIGA